MPEQPQQVADRITTTGFPHVRRKPWKKNRAYTEVWVSKDGTSWSMLGMEGPPQPPLLDADAMLPEYLYSARCDRVVDGDTFVAAIDLGFRAQLKLPIRLHGVNAPEHNEPAGGSATEYLRELLGEGSDATPLVLQSYRDRRSFERWVADAWIESGANAGKSVAQLIIDNGHGVPFMV